MITLKIMHFSGLFIITHLFFTQSLTILKFLRTSLKATLLRVIFHICQNMYIFADCFIFMNAKIKPNRNDTDT